MPHHSVRQQGHTRVREPRVPAAPAHEPRDAEAKTAQSIEEHPGGIACSVRRVSAHPRIGSIGTSSIDFSPSIPTNGSAIFLKEASTGAACRFCDDDDLQKRKESIMLERHLHAFAPIYHIMQHTCFWHDRD